MCQKSFSNAQEIPFIELIDPIKIGKEFTLVDLTFRCETALSIINAQLTSKLA